MDTTSPPLADYFWIAGIESIVYEDVPPAAPVENIIVEDREPLDHDGANDVTRNGSSSRTSSATGSQRLPAARHSRQNSGNRFSKLSLENRLSLATLDDLDGNTSSNRSSATIRPAQIKPAECGATGTNGTNANGHSAPNGVTMSMFEGGGQFPDNFDFDSALVKFAAERESFLDDLSFSAGAKVEARTPMINPRAERIRADGGEPAGGRISPFKSIKGSIRRKMSFRDMNSVRKQPSTLRPGVTSRSGQ